MTADPRSETPIGGRESLDALRAEIAAIDEAILRSMAARLEVARRIGRVKATLNAPVRDFLIEREVMERGRRICAGLGIDGADGERVLSMLMEMAIDVQLRDQEVAD